MTYPQQAPQMPMAPQVPQQQQYAPQMPMAPQQGYPQMPQQGGYPQMPQQGYPMVPQQGGYPQMPQQGGYPPVAAGSLDDFYDQPSSGQGASLQFPQVGSAHVWVVNRPLQDSDVEPDMDKQGQVKRFKNGKPKLIMKVPVNVPVSERHTEGRGQWYCRGAARDELSRAMAAAGAPAGPPEAGAFGYTACVGERTIPGVTVPAKVYQVQYYRPGPQAKAMAEQYGIAYPDLSGAPAAPAPVVQAAPAPVAPAAPAPVAQAPAPVAPPAPMVQAPAAPVAPAPVAPPAPGAVAGLPEDKAALLAQLTGAQPQG
jgi:hypothetical protein